MGIWYMKVVFIDLDIDGLLADLYKNIIVKLSESHLSNI